MAPRAAKRMVEPSWTTACVGVRPGHIGGDWGVGVSCGDFGDVGENTGMPATAPCPQFSGACMGMEMTRRTLLAQATHLKIYVQDLNVVNLVAKWQRGEAQEMRQARDRQREEFPRGLVLLHTFCMSRGDTLSVQQKPPFERLNTIPGADAAQARVRSVMSSSFFFYPSNVHLDCFEVRFLDKKTGAARYERFFVSSEISEVENYINIAAEMGDAARLDPATLALDDPGMFWAVCLRFEACSSQLKKYSPGWATLAEKVREARLRAAADGWDWSNLFNLMLAKGGGGSQGHKDFAQRGYLLALKHTLLWAGDVTALHIEEDENDTVGLAEAAINQAGINQANNTSAINQTNNTQVSEELEVGAKVRVHSLKSVAHSSRNGCQGTLLRYLSDTQRWEVLLHVSPPANLAIRLRNLTFVGNPVANLSRRT